MAPPTHHPDQPGDPFRVGPVLPALAIGFLAVALMWAAWFLTHLPGLRLLTPLAALLILAAMLAAMVLGGWAAGRCANWRVGLLAGLVAAAVNLLILFPAITQVEDVRPAAETAAGRAEAPAADPTPRPATPDPALRLETALRPGWPIVVLGFLALGGLVGAIGVAAGGAIAARRPPRIEVAPGMAPPLADRRGWVALLAWVACLSTIELLLVGGLVTSSEAGLAVPDWPGTYGANMFLYPLAMMGHPRIFLEHAHRLFGSMVGLTIIALALAVLLRYPDKRSWLWAIGGAALAVLLGAMIGARGSIAPQAFTALAGLATLAAIVWTVVCFAKGAVSGTAFAMLALVTAQGTLGGVRVTEQFAWMGMFHGVLAQVFFALLVAQAVWLTPAWREAPTSASPDLRRLKRFATGLLHATIFQLLLGATYRHVGTTHALWTHVVWSLAVVVFAVLAAAAAVNVAIESDWLRRRLSRLGKAMMAVVVVQFMLGWVALFLVMQGGGRGPAPTADALAGAADVPIAELLVATAHQANGALLLGLAMAMYVWVKRVFRRPAEGAGDAEA